MLGRIHQSTLVASTFTKVLDPMGAVTTLTGVPLPESARFHSVAETLELSNQ